jgi:biotin carboxyl carrier protein
MNEKLRVKVDGKWYTVEVGDLSARPIQATVDGYPVEVSVEAATPVETAPPAASENPMPTAARQPASPLPPPARPAAPQAAPPARESAAVPTGNVVRAPMPGNILSVAVRTGEAVQAGDHVCTLEAMKMQQSLRSEWTGVVVDVFVSTGDQVTDGAPIIAVG